MQTHTHTLYQILCEVFYFLSDPLQTSLAQGELSERWPLRGSGPEGQAGMLQASDSGPGSLGGQVPLGSGKIVED